MNTIEIYKRIKFAFLIAFIVTAPALVTAGFKIFEVPSFVFFDSDWNYTLNGVMIFPISFIDFLTQKLNILLTYFPPSFLGGLWLGKFITTKSKEKIVRGLKRIEEKEMAKVINKLAIKEAKRFGYKPAYRFKLAGVPIPYAMEAQSFLFLGQAGSGKTQAILNITEQIKDYKECIIAYDFKPDYYTRYYREGIDYLFFPKDKRSISFNLLDQISEEKVFEDISFIVSNIIPEAPGSDAHWILSARSVLKAILLTLFFNTDRSNKEMVEFLRKNQGAEKLRELIQSFPHAEAYGIDITAALSSDKDGNIDGQGRSVYSTINTYLEPLRNEIFISDNEPFSIRNFILANEHTNQDIRLFLVQTTMEQEAYTIWYRTFLALLSREIRSLPNRLDRRIFLLFDEFHSLGEFQEITDALPAEARSKGAVLMLATQSLSKIKAIYGNDLMGSILANTKTKLILAQGDPFGKKTLEEYFGKVEIEEEKESYSRGSGLNSNRINTSTNIITKPVVMDNEFLSLKPLEGFIQIDEYVSKIEFSPVSVQEITSFLPRKNETIAQEELRHRSISQSKAELFGALNEKLEIDRANATNDEVVVLRQKYEQEREKIMNNSKDYSFGLI